MKKQDHFDAGMGEAQFPKKKFGKQRPKHSGKKASKKKK